MPFRLPVPVRRMAIGASLFVAQAGTTINNAPVMTNAQPGTRSKPAVPKAPPDGHGTMYGVIPYRKRVAATGRPA